MSDTFYGSESPGGYPLSNDHLIGGMATDRIQYRRKSARMSAFGGSRHKKDQPSKRPNSRSSTATRGLRQFSLRVCKKVEERGITTYNEVADELVVDMGGEVHRSDQKNIRRRVYDALNVLMAMNIIKKDKKDIVWQGLPSDIVHDLENYRQELATVQDRIQQKRRTLYELFMRHVAMKNLIERNRAREEALMENAAKMGLTPRPTRPLPSDIFHLPFIIISSPRDCQIKCEMLEDRSHYFFKFDSPFLIHGDLEVLKMMGLCQPQKESSLDLLDNPELWDGTGEIDFVDSTGLFLTE